jgi:hypothetical protein
VLGRTERACWQLLSYLLAYVLFEQQALHAEVLAVAVVMVVQ